MTQAHMVRRRHFQRLSYHAIQVYRQHIPALRPHSTRCMTCQLIVIQLTFLCVLMSVTVYASATVTTLPSALFSGCLLVRRCMHDPGSLRTRYLIKCLAEFRQIYKFGAVMSKDKLSRF